MNEISIELEQLNRKKSEVDVKLSESTKTFEKFNKKVIDLEKFKSDIEFVYNRGINKEKISSVKCDLALSIYNIVPVAGLKE